MISPLYASDQLAGDGLAVSGQEDDAPSFHSKFLSAVARSTDPQGG